MSLVRLISRLDIKGPTLVKGIQLEGVRQLGSPEVFAEDYYRQHIDEILYMDVVASLYNRNSLREIVAWTSERVFVPLTVGGGIRTVEDAISLFKSGADKVAVNTAALRRPELISEIANATGSQSIVLSIEAKSIGTDRWEAFMENGREKSGCDVIDWARQGERLGAGEILLTSVDNEGTRRGCDLALLNAVSSAVNIPVIYSGGVGKPGDVVDAIKVGGASAVAMADILHYKRYSLEDVHQAVRSAGFKVRPMYE
jgi:cyclase